MNTKRMTRWIIVLFLLAALPGLTAALAQEREPADRLSANCNYGASSIDLNEETESWVFSDPEGDEGVQMWATTFVVPANRSVLISITDFTTIPSNQTHAIFTLARRVSDTSFVALYEVRPYREGHIFATLPAGEYCFFEDYDPTIPYYTFASYNWTLSTPLLISAASANLGTGNVAGIPFQAGDILAHSDLNNGGQRWVMLFDASDVGITKNVSNIEANREDEIVLSLAANQTVAGVGVVTPWDTIIFDPVSYGSNTAGSFRMGFDGSMNQLTASGEKLDAIATSQYCDYLSTTGTATVPFYMGYNIKFKDEDLGCWYQDVEWLFGFESRNVTGLPVEDVIAAAYDDAADKMYLTILGSGKIAGHKVTQKDIFAISYPGYTWGGVIWHGPDHGWNYNIDAFEFDGW